MPTATERVFLASPTTGRANAALAAPWLFTGEDNLRLVIVNSSPGVVVTLAGRRLGPQDTSPQPFAYTATPTSDRTANTFNFAFGDGFLLNCSLVVSSGGPLVGQTYCMLRVIRGFTGATVVLGALLGGYVTAQQHLAYPGSPIQTSIDGGGYIRSVVGTAPAAGANFSDTVPFGARWEVLSVYAEYTTSAAGAPRHVALRPRQGPQVQLWSVPQATQPPSSTGWAYSWGANLPNAADAIGIIQSAYFSPMILLAGGVIESVVTILDAGDQFTPPHYQVREYLEVN